MVGVAGGEKDDGVEGELVGEGAGDAGVAEVGGVEGAAEEADAALKFSVDLDFEKTIDTAMLQQLFSAAQLGMVSPETVWDYLQTGQIPERGWDDEQGRILGAGLTDGRP